MATFYKLHHQETMIAHAYIASILADMLDIKSHHSKLTQCAAEQIAFLTLPVHRLNVLNPNKNRDTAGERLNNNCYVIIQMRLFVCRRTVAHALCRTWGEDTLFFPEIYITRILIYYLSRRKYLFILFDSGL